MSVSISAHLAAFSTMLARDRDTAQLHIRDLQVIAFLVSQGIPVSVGVVAAQLGLSSPSVSRIAVKLASLKLITRAEHPDDLRITLLEPTLAGRALDDRVRANFHPG